MMEPCLISPQSSEETSVFSPAFQQTSAYRCLQQIAVTHQLFSDMDIVQFLLKGYIPATAESPSKHTFCQICFSPLQLLCVRCCSVKTWRQSCGDGEESSDSKRRSPATHSVQADAEPTGEHTPQSRHPAVITLFNNQPFTSGSDPGEQTPQSWHPGLTFSTTIQPFTSGSDPGENTPPQAFSDGEDGSADSDGQTMMHPPISSVPASGPGQNQEGLCKHEIVSLSYPECGETMSSRQALLDHLYTQHSRSVPETKMFHAPRQVSTAGEKEESLDADSGDVKRTAIVSRLRKRKRKPDSSVSDNITTFSCGKKIRGDLDITQNAGLRRLSELEDNDDASAEYLYGKGDGGRNHTLCRRNISGVKVDGGSTKEEGMGGGQEEGIQGKTADSDVDPKPPGGRKTRRRRRPQAKSSLGHIDQTDQSITRIKKAKESKDVQGVHRGIEMDREDGSSKSKRSQEAEIYHEDLSSPDKLDQELEIDLEDRSSKPTSGQELETDREDRSSKPKGGNQKSGDGSRAQRHEARLCERCGASFPNSKQLLTHRAGCQSSVCQLCGREVKRLRTHMTRHLKSGRFQCPYCPKAFPFRTNLQQHLVYHTKEKPHVCEVCGASYREKARLNDHLRTHSGDKPFRCSQCGATFTRSRGLRDHQRVHSGEKPYECGVCGRSFANTGNLAAHRRNVHKLKPLPCNHDPEVNTLKRRMQARVAGFSSP